AMNRLLGFGTNNPPDIQWHHLVEQSAEGGSGFLVRTLNSMINLVPTPTAIHQAITTVFNSRAPWLANVESTCNLNRGRSSIASGFKSGKLPCKLAGKSIRMLCERSSWDTSD